MKIREARALTLWNTPLLIMKVKFSIQGMKSIYQLMAFSFLSLSIGQVFAQQNVDLLPLEVGDARVYEVSKFGPYYPCRSGLEVSRVLGTTQVNGFETYVTEFCGYRGYVRKEFGQVLVFHAPENRWILDLDIPVDGLRWEEFYAMSEWREIGDYFVNDTLYSSCFEKNRLVSYQHFSVYCDGVGLVHERMIDLRGFGWDRKLRSILPNTAKR